MKDNIRNIEIIYQYSKYYGNILYECEDLYNEGRGLVLINAFFYILENIIKSINEDFESKFIDNINKSKPFLSKKEIKFLHDIRKKRNIYIHDDLNMNFIEIDGIAYNCADEDTALMLYQNLSSSTYNILVKLMKNKINI